MYSPGKRDEKTTFVETGIDNNVDVEIIKGLNQGDKLIDT
jgi:hypothetical protein